MTLTEFLRARIAEQQAEAEKIKAAIDADPGAFASIVHDHPELAAGDCAGWLADYDPARVLAECAAKRRIVERHQSSADTRGVGQQRNGQWTPYCEYESADWPCPDVTDLAAVYADHPDCRSEWKP